MPSEIPVALAAKQFEGLADVTRLRIICLLTQYEVLTPTRMIELLGIKNAALHHHLSTLLGLNWVLKQQRGNITIYALNTQTLLSMHDTIITIQTNYIKGALK